MKHCVAFNATNFAPHKSSTSFENLKHGIWEYDWSIRIEHLFRLKCERVTTSAQDRRNQAGLILLVSRVQRSAYRFLYSRSQLLVVARVRIPYIDNWRSTDRPVKLIPTAIDASFKFSSNTAHVRETESYRRLRGGEKISFFSLRIPNFPSTRDRSSFRRTEAPFPVLNLLSTYYHLSSQH